MPCFRNEHCGFGMIRLVYAEVVLRFGESLAQRWDYGSIKTPKYLKPSLAGLRLLGEGINSFVPLMRYACLNSHPPTVTPNSLEYSFIWGKIIGREYPEHVCTNKSFSDRQDQGIHLHE